ncbi:MAG: aromatic ring-hydroxylating dioxygenase subunit alpha [Burkholderiaceae bacterium]
MKTVHAPMNAWYVAGTPEEVANGPLGRTICGRDICFYLDANRQLQAVEDFCPHRGAPLSLGAVCDGVLVCGYHGLQMGGDGKTIAMPGQRVQKFPVNRVFPAAERNGYLWVWPGDPTKAIVDNIPKPEWAGRADWVFSGGMFRVACDYRLLIDNLMDLTHETYVHSGSIGQKEIDEAPPETNFHGDEVSTVRHMKNVKAPPFWQHAMRGNGIDPELAVDRWQVCRFETPSNVMIDVGVALAGKGGIDAAGADKASGIVVDYITPETDSSCWYFWGLARHFQASDAALTHEIRTQQDKIFSEDLDILERQQKNLMANPSRKLLKLNIDAGGVHARRIIDKLCQSETSG